MSDLAETDPIIALSEWFRTPAGAYVRQWEQARFDALTADIFGFHALQVGLPEIDALRANRMPHRWFADRRWPCEAAKDDETSCINAIPSLSVIHDYGDLPFANHSLDLIVLPHVLEFSREPHQILREVERVLIPEGQVIICGFNPVSLWGMRQKLGRATGARFLPLDGEFISLGRMKDWLKLLSMETNRGHFGCYLPPCASSKAFDRYTFLDKVGDRWWPFLGGVYMVQAIKRVRGMTLVGPVRTKTKLQVRNVPVAGKNIHHKNGQS